mgnify:CR=1 FL=1
MRVRKMNTNGCAIIRLSEVAEGLIRRRPDRHVDYYEIPTNFAHNSGCAGSVTNRTG